MSVGIQETKEAVVAGLEIGVFVTSRLKDGIGVGDFAAFWDKFQNDEAFKNIVKAGWDKHEAIPEEVKDLDIGEAIQLGGEVLSYIPKFVEAVK